jgi:hypothetical protein
MAEANPGYTLRNWKEVVRATTELFRKFGIYSILLAALAAVSYTTYERDYYKTRIKGLEEELQSLQSAHNREISALREELADRDHRIAELEGRQKHMEEVFSKIEYQVTKGRLYEELVLLIARQAVVAR